MPPPSGSVMKACLSPSAVWEAPRHLPGVIDAKGDTVISTQRPEIGHARAIGAGDKSVPITCGRAGNPHHLPDIIDVKGLTPKSTQRPKISQGFAIDVQDV